MIAKSIAAACLIAIAMMLPIVLADDVDSDLAGFPAELWQQPAKGGAVAMLLGYFIRAEGKKPALRIYIKNSSNKDEWLPADGDGSILTLLGSDGTSRSDRVIQAFCIKDDGTKIPLGNYTPVIHSATNPLIITMPPMPSVKNYHPGEMVVETIELSTDQLTMLRQYPVVCRFLFYPVATPTMEVHFIETTPIKVTEKKDGELRY